MVLTSCRAPGRLGLCDSTHAILPCFWSQMVNIKKRQQVKRQEMRQTEKEIQKKKKIYKKLIKGCQQHQMAASPLGTKLIDKKHVSTKDRVLLQLRVQSYIERKTNEQNLRYPCLALYYGHSKLIGSGRGADRKHKNPHALYLLS